MRCVWCAVGPAHSGCPVPRRLVEFLTIFDATGRSRQSWSLTNVADWRALKPGLVQFLGLFALRSLSTSLLPVSGFTPCFPER